ncbi:helicase [Singapore grouper iridovirus]|nr:helicase [Singapore grouper iridovirus]
MAKLLDSAVVACVSLPRVEGAQLHLQTKTGEIHVPYAWAVSALSLRPPRFPECTKSAQSCGTPRPHQVKALAESIKILKNKGHCLLKCPPGFGKTFMALKIWSELRMPVVVLTHRKMLAQQWADSAAKFTQRHVVREAPSKSDTENYIVIMNPTRLKDENSWPERFFLVVDEVHQMTSPRACQLLLKVRPTFLLGLSATPMRYDDYHPAVAWFFGDKDCLVERTALRSHVVLQVSTKFDPPIKINKKGQVDWNDVIYKMSSNVERNDLIVKCLSAYPHVKWLVMCKRIEQVKTLCEKLADVGTVDYIYGTKNVWNKTAWCLVGTYSKIGVGFDAGERQGICLATDIDRYFEQCVGRLRNSNGLVLDFKDAFRPMIHHVSRRLKVYKNLNCAVVPVDGTAGSSIRLPNFSHRA